MRPRLAITGALALAAASAGVVVPVLRGFVEHAGRGPIAASVFIDAHVLGGVLGAACGVRALRRAGSARGLATAALAASVAVLLAMLAIDSFELRVGLRFVDGGCHLLAITALAAAATSGDAELRARRAVTMGLAIVLGIAAGFGVGALLHQPDAALAVAAMMSAGAAVIVASHRITSEAPEPTEPAAPRRSRDPRPVAPGLLAFGERFIFGTMSVAGPFLAPPARVGLVLGVSMLASVVALPIARHYALGWGARRLAVRSTLAFATMLGAAAIVDVFASSGRALAWAIAFGAAAGALYASALVLVARSRALEDRARGMAAVHASGNAGFALGALSAGVLVPVLPGTLVIALPGIAIIAAAALGVWLTVPGAGAAPASEPAVVPADCA